MEDFETTCLDDWRCDFLLEYLGHSASGERVNVTQHLADFSRWTSRGAPQKINYAGQYLLRYRVLDIFMDTMMAFRHPDLATVPRSQLPPLTKRLNGVHNSLSDWTQCISRFLSLLDARDAHAQEIPRPGGLTLLPWHTPQNTQSKVEMSICSAVDSPTPAQLDFPDQENELTAFEQSVVNYSPPPSSPSKVDPSPPALPTKDTPSLSSSDLSALMPYVHSGTLVQGDRSPGMSENIFSPSIVLSAGVSHLLSCQRHHAEASKHKVLFNLELAAFALSWMAMVYFCS